MKIKILWASVAALAVLAIAAGIWYYASQTEPEQPNQEMIEEVKVLRFGHDFPEDGALHLAAEKFAVTVIEKSGGRLKVELFTGQKLGNAQQMIEMTRSGKLDILLSPTAKLSVLVPAMQYADLPFLFPTREDAYEMLDGIPGNMLLDQLLPMGLVGATFWENGFKHFTANKFIHSPEDFKGLNIRVMKSRIIIEQFRSMGANPIPIDFHTTYQALKDGVVDGQENPLVAIVSMKFHEVQPHLTISNHAYLSYVLCFSKDVFESLSPDLQNILMTAAREITPFERKETAKQEEKL